MSASNYLENVILASLLDSSTWYVALHTADPTETGATGEVSGGSYARKDVVASNGTEWTTPSGGATENINAIVFVQATANWGTITHCSIWDSVSGGNCLLYGALNAAKVINNGDIFEFAAGDAHITCD